MKRLGVNIDHIATIREARKINYPDPVEAVFIAENAGADQITIHLREDRRHIQDRDVYIIRNVVKTSLNLEMALNDDIIEIALKTIPDEVCIVPERREEITTEGGLDVISSYKKLKEIIPKFKALKIKVSIFIDPDEKQIDAASEVGADFIEIHTGKYAEAIYEENRIVELEKIKKAAKYAVNKKLRVNAGHGLNYKNTSDIAAIPEIETLNIGHSIISRAIFVGLDRAIKDMKAIIDKYNC